MALDSHECAMFRTWDNDHSIIPWSCLCVKFTAGYSFEVVYGFNPLSPLDILALPLQERVNMDANDRAEFMRKMHADKRTAIERQVQRHASKVNTNKKPMVFQLGDLV